MKLDDLSLEQSIIIISTPRSGSSALTRMIAKKYEYNWFIEPEAAENPVQNLDDFNSAFDKKEKFILKVHSLNISKYRDDIQKYIKFNPDLYRIKLRRKDIIAQTTSLYISWLTRVFHFRPWQKQEKLVININDTLIHDVVKHMIRHYQSFDNDTIIANQTILYEELTLDDDIIVKNLKPVNYDELYYKIKVAYDKI